MVVAVRGPSRANSRPVHLLKVDGQSIELGIGKKWHMVQGPWQGRLGVMRSSAKPHMGCFQPHPRRRCRHRSRPPSNGSGDRLRTLARLVSVRRGRVRVLPLTGA